MTTQDFFERLFEYCEGSSYVWTIPDKSTTQFSDWFGMTAKAEAASRVGKDVYYSVGLVEKSLEQFERAKSTDIIGIPGLWIDIDIASDAHAADNLPPDYTSARGLLPDNWEPSFVVSSGHGIHVYYLFREMLETKTDEDRAFAMDLLKRMQGTVRTKAQSNGWHVDSTADLCRVLRVPGTINHKRGHNIQCEVTEFSDARYNPEDFDDVLPSYVESTTSCSNQRTERFERRATDGSSMLMLQNCNFLQYWQQNFKTLPEPMWKAACTNLLRGVDGNGIILPMVKDWLGSKFNENMTQQRMNHYLNECTPQTCDYIRHELGYSGCGDCQGIKTPCAWSLAKVPQAVAKIRAITVPTNEIVFSSEIKNALAIVQKENVGEWAKFKEKCRGIINLRDLNRELKRMSAPAGVLQEGQHLGDVTTKQIIPTAPIDLMVPPNFQFGGDGIHEVKNSDNGPRYILCSGQPILITHKVYNIDTSTEKIGLAFLYYNAWRPVLAKRSEVFSARGIVNMTDCGLNASSESAKPLVRYLQALEAYNPNIPVVHSVSKIGWREGSLSEFILPSVNNKYVIDMDDDGSISAAFQQGGSLVAWTEFGKRIREHPYARFLLAASLAAPLLKIFNERNFMVYFWGTSGGAKTAAMYFAMSVWGIPEKMVRSFYGTTNGIERAAEFSNDFPLAINERQVAVGSNKQESLEALVYMLEGGRGKVRASRSGIRTTSTWRTISMATGEEPLSKESSVQGIKTRLIEINTYPVLPNELGKSVYSFTSVNYGKAGVKYMENLIAEHRNGYHDIRAAHDSLVKRLKEDFPNLFEPHIDAIALICIADYLASQWLFSLSQPDAAQSTYELSYEIARQMPTKQEVSDVERARQYVTEWLVSNKRRFPEEGADSEKYLSPEYGFIADGLYNVYPSYLSDALDNKGFKAGKILKEFADKGYINTANENGKRRFKIRLRRNGERVYVVQIPVGGD